jgi:hypothetical protein
MICTTRYSLHDSTHSIHSDDVRSPLATLVTLTATITNDISLDVMRHRNDSEIDTSSTNDTSNDVSKNAIVINNDSDT